MNIQDEYQFNITQLEDAFSISRNTIRKRLKNANVFAVGKVGNAPVYHIAAAAKAILAPDTLGDGEYCGYDSPDKMSATERKHWYESERSRVQLEVESKELIPVHEVVQGYYELVKAVVDPLDSLPDLLEQKCSITGEALERVQRQIDAIREQMYLRAMREGVEQLLDDD